MRHPIRSLCLLIVCVLAVAACHDGASDPSATAATPTAAVAAPDAAAVAPAWPQSDTAVTPLLLGNALPDVALQTIDGQPTTLKDAVGGQPAVLVFYRGGWCPFCNLQLSGLRLIRRDLDALGYRLIAISPDTPAELKKTLDKDALDYTLLSDSSAAAMRAFGIGYEVNADMLQTLSGHGIDLEKASGETHHVLPVPSVYLTDSNGVLQFSYIHPDYKIRLPHEVVLAAARAISKHEHEIKPQ